MSEERKASLVFTAENQTKGTLQEIKTDVTQTAATVERSGQKAAKGIEAIGGGSDKAAAKLEGATRSIIGSIQRTTAAAEAGEKGTAKYFETLGRQRGVSGDVLEPYLAQLRAAEAAQAAAATSMSNMGMSAKATAAAMRGVPAQISDIFVSLQGGMPVMTVFFQQGLQLRDMFGGFTAAGQALGTTLLGMVNPLTLAGAAAVALGAAYYQGSKEVDALRLALVSTGNASGVSLTQLQLMAAEMGRISGSESSASAALARFAAAGVVGTDSLKSYAQAAIDWEKATGQAVEKTAEQFASLQKDPLKAAMELQKGMKFLTVATYDQIRALEEQGDKLGAARVLMGAYTDALNGGSRQIRENLGLLESSWDKLGKTVGAVWNLMLGAGRASTLADKIGGVKDDIDGMERQLTQRTGFGNTGGGAATGRGNAALSQRDIEALRERINLRKQELAGLEKTAQQEKEDADRKSKEDAKVEARHEWNQRGLKYLSDAQKLESALKEERQLGIEAGYSEAEIEKRLAAVRESFAKKGVDATKAAESAYKSLMTSINEKIAAMEKEGQTGDKLTETEKLRIKYQEELATKGKQLNAQQRENIETRLKVAEATERQLTMMRELKKAWEEDAKAYEAMVKRQEAQVASINASVSKMRLEEEGHMLAAAAGISHAEAMERITVARLEDSLAQAQQGAGTQEEIDRIQREITARKELLTVLQQRSFREANKRAAEDAAKDWDRTAQTISRTLADYIMGGGKDAAQYLKRLFATLVLEPIVQYGVKNAMGIMGLGPQQTGMASSGGLGNMGWTTNMSNLAEMGGYGLTAANAMGTLYANTTNTGIDGLLATNGAYGTAQTTTMGTLGTGLSYAGAVYAATQGQWGSAIGTAIGTYFGGPIGAAIGSVIGGFADSLLGDEDAPYYGGVSSWSASTGTQTAAEATYGTGMWLQEDSPAMRQTLGTFAQTLGTSLDAFAKAFGSKAGYEVALGYADDSTSDNAWGALRIALGGQDVVNWDANRQTRWAPREFADGEEGYKQYLSAVAADVKTALLGMDLPGWADQILASAKDLETLNAALQQIGTVKAVFDSLGHSMTMFADLGGSVQTTLLNVSGGIDALANNAQSFYANYFSEQEHLDAIVDSLTATFAKYGAALPATAEQYRALVEQQLAAGDAGAEFAAVLLGLNGTFKGVADAWKVELDGMSQTVVDFFAGIKDDIAAVMADVAGSRKDILRGTGVMTAAEIEAAIGAAMIYSPSTTGVVRAQGATASAAAAVAATQTRADGSAAQYAQKQGGVNAAQSALDAGNAQKAALEKQAQGLADWINSLWDGGANSGYNYGKRKKWSDEAVAQLVVVNQQIAGMGPNLDALSQEVARQQALAAQASIVAGSDAQQLAAAQAALAAAQKAELQAKADYAAQMQKFVMDAGQSVGKLSDLRGEVADFYEAQAQAVQGMLQSAGNLRSLADQVRLGQLTTAQTAAELGNRYALDYSMALATTGSTRAGYVDAMAGNLQSLSEAMKAEAVSGTDWRVQTAKLLAQASNAAGLLEGDANTDDYKDVSLGLLDSIDKALQSLSGTTQSAEQVIADAVNNGTASNLAGLRAIVAALQGQSVPAFAAGGLHLGGLRIVGENGPELEATGPSRIWNQRQLAGALGGGGSSVRTEQLLQQLIEEQRVQASRQVDLQLQLNKQMQRWDAMGMPEVREASA